MSLSRRKLLTAIGAFALVAMMGAPSFADPTVVAVTLQDKGAGMDMKTGLGMGMGGDMMMATMRIDAAPNKIKAGKITFEVVNASKEMIHEMIVSPVADLTKPLPYSDNNSRVEEDEYGDLGEVSELEPGTSGKLTIDVTPGTYILYCNVPGHYMTGMWTLITVEP